MENLQNQEVQPIQPVQPEKKRGVSTLAGIIIIIASALILFGGVFAYQYFFAKPTTESINVSTPFIFGGTYSFTEFLPETPGLTPSQTWVYRLDISSNDGRWHVGLSVDGHLEDLKINATANNVDNSLDVIFDSNEPGAMDLGFKKGDVLFRLTPSAKGLAIKWIKLLPNLDSSVGNSFFEKEPEVSTAGWKTYTNSEYGFEIKYPKEWGVYKVWHPETDGIGGAILGRRGEGDYIGVNVDVIFDKNKLEEFSHISKKYLTERSGISYLIFPNNVSDDEFNQIISTFKFTK